MGLVKGLCTPKRTCCRRTWGGGERKKIIGNEPLLVPCPHHIHLLPPEGKTVPRSGCLSPNQMSSWTPFILCPQPEFCGCHLPGISQTHLCSLQSPFSQHPSSSHFCPPSLFPFSSFSLPSCLQVFMEYWLLSCLWGSTSLPSRRL